MLRYFYLIICIQMCFCSVYFDNTLDYEGETIEKRKTTKVSKKHTRSPKSRTVLFDVKDFMQGSDESADYSGYNVNNNRNDRYSSSNDAGYMEPGAENEFDYNKVNNHYETPNADHRAARQNDGNFEPIDRVKYNIVRTKDKLHKHKYLNPKHFSFQSLNQLKTENNKVSNKHKKTTLRKKERKGSNNKKVAGNCERKCLFKNMKIPFIPHKKATVKTKKYKKRGIFYFNSKKTTTTAQRVNLKASSVIKHDNLSKDNIKETEVSNTEMIKVRKRSYEQICPKCIKEFLINMRKKTTISKSKHTTAVKKCKDSKKISRNEKLDKENNFDKVSNERMKRNEEEDHERDWRLKELEEVERRIESVHVTAPNFHRIN